MGKAIVVNKNNIRKVNNYTYKNHKSFNYKILNEFIKIMKKNNSNEELILMKNNLKNFLWVFSANRRRIEGNLGMYLADENKAYINMEESKKEVKLNCWHEFLHMSSRLSVDNTYYTGFGYDGDDLIYGTALTEGYTELLMDKYFNKEAKEKVKEVYILEKKICLCLDCIFGHNNLQNLYFTANNLEFLNLLNTYANSKKEVMDFIMSTDDTHCMGESIAGIAKLKNNIDYNNIIKTLVNWNTNKCILEYYKDNNYNKLIRDCYEFIDILPLKLGNLYKSFNVNITLISINEVKNMINEIISNKGISKNRKTKILVKKKLIF